QRTGVKIANSRRERHGTVSCKIRISGGYLRAAPFVWPFRFDGNPGRASSAAAGASGTSPKSAGRATTGRPRVVEPTLPGGVIIPIGRGFIHHLLGMGKVDPSVGFNHEQWSGARDSGEGLGVVGSAGSRKMFWATTTSSLAVVVWWLWR